MKLQSGESATGIEGIEDECRASLLMAEFAELILRVHEEPEKPMQFTVEYKAAENVVKSAIHASRRWKEAIDMGEQLIVCEEAVVASLLAAGALYEVSL
jgi:hypothetical protein